MNKSVFIQIDFYLLIAFSIILPVGIYGFMMWKKSISRRSVLGLGICLLTISGFTFFLLQRLAVVAKLSPNLYDDWIFSSEVSMALYLLPALFAGLGINIISHVLIKHLRDAEENFDQLKLEKTEIRHF
jgi:ABC-type transport system involved in multi-copper enzyme maturation permease subunit